MIKNILLYRYSFLQKAVMFLLFFMALGSTKALAQFAITEDFRNSGAPDIIIGGPSATPGTGEGRAYLTSGINDPVGAGWLRITNSNTYQKGFAYINKSFPSTMGVLVDFEYKMWRDVNADGADGIGVFLFNANSTFQLGGYGGSLGYAPGGSSTTGLAGGYVGVGLDAYGNFSNPSEGRVGGPGETPNAVVLRGPTTTNSGTTNRYLAGVALGNRDGNNGDIRQRNELDYNTTQSTRPTDAQFYRRVQIEIVRLDAAGIYYNIIVRWKKGPNDDFTDLITYTTTDVPPALLKLGFAAATGGDRNYHEIRNLMVTTPGNVRVVKKADKDILRTNNTTNGTITYTIEVTNDTDNEVGGIQFTDKITDAYGNDIPHGNPGFDITNISATGFVSASLPTASTLTTNEITGTLVLAAKKTGRITVTGILYTIPPGNVLQNTATALPEFDEDKNNNTFVVRTPVMSEDTDLILTKTVTAECITSGTPPTFTVYASNIGALNRTYNRLGTSGPRIAIMNIVPPGYAYNDASTPGGFAGTISDPQNGNTTARWSRVELTDFPSTGFTTYGYIARGTNTSGATETLDSGKTYPYPVTYTMTPPAGTASYNDTTSALMFTDLNYTTSIETPQNQGNNSATITMYNRPPAPTVASGTLYYCIGEDAPVLSANVTNSAYKLRYYSTQGGFSSEYPIKPTTAWSGTYTYYVTQVNGTCEGPTASITVVVMPGSVGSINASTLVVCPGTQSQITGTNINGASYRWQSSPDGVNWNDLSNTGKDLTTPAINATTFFRRMTSVTANGKTCEGPTNSLRYFIPYAGVIGGSQSGCNDDNPSTFSNIASGETGSIGGVTYTYQWQFSTDGNSGWTDISGATGETYNEGTIYSTRYYRRVIRYNGCSVPSNIVAVAIGGSNNPSAGTISGNQTICPGDTPTAITSSNNGSQGYYRWEISTNGTNYSILYDASVTSPTYQPGPLTQTTYYRRTKVSGCGTSSGLVITKTVNNPATGSISGTQTICYNGNATIASPQSGSTGYRWEYAEGTTGGTWLSMANTSASISVSSLTSSRRYRRFTVSGSCESAPTAVVTITVKQQNIPGTISGNQNLCNNAAWSTFTGTPATSDDAITYQWQRSANGASGWTAAAGTNNLQDYTPNASTLSGYYRRSATTSCGTVYSNIILATRQAAISNGTTGSNQTICNGAAPAQLNGSAVTAATDFTITYRWEESSTGTGGWSTVATTQNYQPGNLTATRYYKRTVISSMGGNSCESTGSGNIMITVNAAIGAGSISPNSTQTICYGGNVAFTSTGAGTGGGTFTYRYESSTTGNVGSWNTIAGPSASGDYTVTNLTATTFFRRVAISNSGGINCEAPTNPVQVVVQDAVNPGTISAASTQTICSGSTATLTSASNGSGSGSIAYRWEMSTTGTPGTWGTAPGPNAVDGVNYTTPALTGTRYFRRVTISTQGVACEAFTGTIVVTVQGCKLITNPMIYQRVKN